MTPSEETQLRNACREVRPGTVLRLTATSDERSAEMAQFCERVAALLPQVSVAREDGSENEHPLIWLPNGVRYQGVPQGSELPPFIQALSGERFRRWAIAFGTAWMRPTTLLPSWIFLSPTRAPSAPLRFAD